MFCPRCYFNAQNGEKECPLCGTPLQPVPAGYPVYPSYASSVPHEPETVIGVVKRTASSVGFLVAAIAFTLSVVLNFIGIIQLGDMVNGFVSDYADTIAEDEVSIGDTQVQHLYLDEKTADWIAVIMAVPGFIIGAVQAVSMWCIYAAGKNKKHPAMRTGGLTELRMINWLLLVLAGILGAIVVLSLLVFIIGSFLVNTFMGVVMFFICAVIGALYSAVIVFHVKIEKTLKTIIQTVQTGVPSDEVSAFVAVVWIIQAVHATLGSAFVCAIFGPWIMLGSLAKAGCCIAFSVVLLQYRNRMHLFMYTPPVSGTGVYAIPAVPPVSVYTTANAPYMAETPNEKPED